MNNNNYKIIRTIYENVFQRVLECKDNDNGDIFYNNVITSQRVINLIDIDGLNSLSTNILKCYRTEDRMYIITKPLEAESRSLKEYVKNSNLTLKQQFALSKKIIELSSEIFNMTDVVQQKIIDLDKIHIDKNERIIIDCNLIFEQEYDIADNETLKRMGNLLHFVFSGSEIEDYNISELIPPDILKIIVRCLTREYMYPKNALSELVSSPIYKMINPDSKSPKENGEKSSKVIIQSHLIKENEQNDVISLKESLINSDDENDYGVNKDDESILNIYLNDTDDMESNSFNKRAKLFLINNDVKKIGISLLIVILVLLLGSYLMNKFGKQTKEVSGGKANVIQLGNSGDNNTPGTENIDGTKEDAIDSTNKFFNIELLNKVNYTGLAAEVDKDIYVEGENSLVIKNDGDEKIKSLFATIDFSDPNYSYMLKQQIAVSAKTKSESDLSALIVLEAYKDEMLASTFHTTVQIYNDMWSPNVVPINVTNADSLNIYIEYSGKNKVWIDSVNIDVIK